MKRGLSDLEVSKKNYFNLQLVGHWAHDYIQQVQH